MLERNADACRRLSPCRRCPHITIQHQKGTAWHTSRQIMTASCVYTFGGNIGVRSSSLSATLHCVLQAERISDVHSPVASNRTALKEIILVVDTILAAVDTGCHHPDISSSSRSHQSFLVCSRTSHGRFYVHRYKAVHTWICNFGMRQEAEASIDPEVVL